MVFKNGQRFEVELSTSFENKDTLVFLANRDIAVLKECGTGEALKLKLHLNSEVYKRGIYQRIWF